MFYSATPPTGPAAAAVGEVADVVDVVRKLTLVDFHACDSVALADVAKLISRVDGFLHSCTAAVSHRSEVLHAAGKSAAPAEVLARHGNMSAREAKRAARRAAALAKAPAMKSALGNGDVGSGHADAMANATSTLTDTQRDQFFEHDAELAAKAANCSPERFGEHCKQLASSLQEDEGASVAQQQQREVYLRKFINPTTNMYVLNGQFDPELGAVIFKAINDEASALFRSSDPGLMIESLRHDPEYVEAHALTNLVRGGRVKRTGIDADITVLIDHQTLVDGVHTDGVCETGSGEGLAVATVRRLACDANIIPAVLSGEGEVLDLGRSQRLANRAQRRALRAMHDTCSWQSCGVPFDHCQIHHLVPWEQGGPTDLAMLRPLCSRHHHHVHEGGWKAEPIPGHGLRITRPDGVHHADVFPRKPPGMRRTNDQNDVALAS